MSHQLRLTDDRDISIIEPPSAEGPGYEVTVSVTRGVDLPHPSQTKRHPTYECTLEVFITSSQCPVYKPHCVERFFDQYRKLYHALQLVGVSNNSSSNNNSNSSSNNGSNIQKIYITAPFPPTYFLSQFGFTLREDLLELRCKLLHNWIQAIFQQFSILPHAAVTLISDLFTITNKEATIANKDRILSLLRRSTGSIKESAVFTDHTRRL